MSICFIRVYMFKCELYMILCMMFIQVKIAGGYWDVKDKTPDMPHLYMFVDFTIRCLCLFAVHICFAHSYMGWAMLYMFIFIYFRTCLITFLESSKDNCPLFVVYIFVIIFSELLNNKLPFVFVYIVSTKTAKYVFPLHTVVTHVLTTN